MSDGVSLIVMKLFFTEFYLEFDDFPEDSRTVAPNL